MQALKRHEKVGVFDAPGDTDLTARVDFGRLKSLAENAGLSAHGPVHQRDLLLALGLEIRAAALLRANPGAKAKVLRQVHRLTDDSEMGELFKALCVSAPGLPDPLGFA